MKKQLFTGAFALAAVGSVSAQGLYDIAPNLDAKESLPIKWNAGLSFNYDDNVTPTVLNGSGEDDGVASVSAYVGASLVNITPQTTWDVFARVGGTFYFDEPEASGEDVIGQARLGVNWAHRVSERLRFSSRNYVAYELEPDYNFGFAVDRQIEEYLHYESDNAVGYRWTDRFATYTGFKVRGIDYQDDFDGNDRLIYSFYNQFRYRASEQTVWTLDYRYSITDSDGGAGDSTNQFITAGIEHRFSPNSVLALKAGVQIRDVDDGGEDGTNPFIEAAIRTRVNEQFSFRAFARYSVEDYGTSFAIHTFDTNNTLRVGLTADYIISPVLTLHGGVNYIRTEFEDGRFTNGFGGTPGDLDQDLINLYVGFSYKVNDGVYVTGSYNWTDSDASGGILTDAAARTYDQNRVSLGVRVEF